MKVRELRSMLLTCDQDAEVIVHPFVDTNGVRTGPIHPTIGVASGVFTGWRDAPWVAIVTTDAWGQPGAFISDPDKVEAPPMPTLETITKQLTRIEEAMGLGPRCRIVWDPGVLTPPGNKMPEVRTRCFRKPNHPGKCMWTAEDAARADQTET